VNKMARPRNLGILFLFAACMCDQELKHSSDLEQMSESLTVLSLRYLHSIRTVCKKPDFPDVVSHIHFCYSKLEWYKSKSRVHNYRTISIIPPLHTGVGERDLPGLEKN
jgi:hypothetical protein